MPFNIQLAQVQKFSTLAAEFQEPAFQKWEFVSEAPQEILYIPGDPDPEGIPLEIKIEDFAQSHPQYDDYLLSVEAVGGETAQAFFDLSGDMAFGEMFSVPSDLKANMVVGFKSFGIVTPGQVLDLSLKFKAYGQTPSGIIEPLNYETVFSFNFTVSGAGGNYVIVSPQETLIGHQRDTDMPAPKTLAVSASGYWRIKYPDDLTLSGGSNYWTDEDGWKNVSGNGNTNLQVALQPSVENSSENMRSYVLPYYSAPSGNETEGEARVKVLLFEEGDEMSANKDSFYFLGVKNQLSPGLGPQLLFVYALGGITLSETSFPLLSLTSGTNILMTQISVPAPENMTTGLHHANITADGPGDESLIIPVTYEVVETLSLNFPDTEFHFTKEHKELTIYSGAYGEAYATIELDIEQDGKKDTYHYELPVFNNRGTFKLGREVHRLFKNVLFKDLFSQVPFIKAVSQFSAVSAQSYWPIKATKYTGIRHYPNPMQVKAYVKIFERDSNDLVGEDSISCSFLKGHRPKIFKGHQGILSYHNPVQRVTPSGRGIVNFSGKNTWGQVIIKRNGTEVDSTIFTTSTNRILSKEIYFSQFAPGDVIEVHVAQSYPFPLKKYYVIPETKQSYHLAWVNECNVIDLMEFTGSLGFNREYKAFESETTDGFIEKLSLLESKKSPAISCNTGFILKESVSLLDSILSSENCWLLLDGHAPINVVPSTKKLDETDTENELYAYELTFKINPATDAEVYSS